VNLIVWFLLWSFWLHAQLLGFSEVLRKHCCGVLVCCWDCHFDIYLHLKTPFEDPAIVCVWQIGLRLLYVYFRWPRRHHKRKLLRGHAWKHSQKLWTITTSCPPGIPGFKTFECSFLQLYTSGIIAIVHSKDHCSWSLWPSEFHVFNLECQVRLVISGKAWTLQRVWELTHLFFYMFVFL